MVEHLASNEFQGWGDEQLAKVAKAGNIEARNALFLRCQPAIERLAGPARVALRRNESGPIEAGDIDQQAFLIFCELVNEWEAERAPFVPYLKRVMPWRLLHYVRGVLRYCSSLKMQPASAIEGWVEAVAAGADEYHLEQAEWAERVAPLNERRRRSLDLRFYVGLSSREIAQISGRSPRTVNRDIRSAMSALHAGLVDEWESCA